MFQTVREHQSAFTSEGLGQPIRRVKEHETEGVGSGKPQGWPQANQGVRQGGHAEPAEALERLRTLTHLVGDVTTHGEARRTDHAAFHLLLAWISISHRPSLGPIVSTPPTHHDPGKSQRSRRERQGRKKWWNLVRMGRCIFRVLMVMDNFGVTDAASDNIRKKDWRHSMGEGKS